MGLQDRQYYQDDSSYTSSWRPSGSGGVPGSRTIVTTLIIINVAIFGLDVLSSIFSTEGDCWLGHFLALKAGLLKEQPWNVWQLLTYGFAHAPIDSKESIFHVGGNMLVLFFLGRPIESRLGKEEFLRFYIASILAAGLVYLAVNFNSPRPMLGASGAVSAVVALFIFFYPHSKLLMFGVFPVRAWILGLILVGTDVLRSFNPESQIAWEAHLAGFAFGAAYFYFKWNFGWLTFGKLGSSFKSKPNLKVHQPDRAEKLKADADRILEKINQEGEASLTSRERKTLKRYSEQIRKGRG